ncbi:STAS domain-containing protein [Streptomyces sp. NPDC091383]|uniref:STAS domain-containing protein n=1 Tax=Streptomyces sp. NPDC091383 TaxID=3365996 RepID=UPI0038183EA0
MHPGSEMKVHATRHEETFVITLRGEVDWDDAEDFEAARETADRAALPVTAIDLSRVTFADSMLLNALLALRRRHTSDGRDLVLLGPLHPAVRRLLVVSGVLDHFTISDTGATLATDRAEPHEDEDSG